MVCDHVALSVCFYYSDMEFLRHPARRVFLLKQPNVAIVNLLTQRCLLIPTPLDLVIIVGLDGGPCSSVFLYHEKLMKIVARLKRISPEIAFLPDQDSPAPWFQKDMDRKMDLSVHHLQDRLYPLHPWFRITGFVEGPSRYKLTMDATPQWTREQQIKLCIDRLKVHMKEDDSGHCTLAFLLDLCHLDRKTLEDSLQELAPSLCQYMTLFIGNGLQDSFSSDVSGNPDYDSDINQISDPRRPGYATYIVYPRPCLPNGLIYDLYFNPCEINGFYDVESINVNILKP